MQGFVLSVSTNCHDGGKVSYCTSLVWRPSPQIQQKPVLGGAVDFWIKCNRTISGMTGICRRTCSIVGSILCVGLGQQRQLFLPPNQPILVYSDMQKDSVAFWGSSNTVFSHTSGCKSQDVINTPADSNQPVTAVKALLHSAGLCIGFHFAWLINAGFGDYCATCSDTWWWCGSSLFTSGPGPSERRVLWLFCCLQSRAGGNTQLKGCYSW